MLLGLILSTTAFAGVKKDIKEGDRALADGRHGAALRAYERALDDEPDNSMVHLRIARLQLAAGNPQNALAPGRVARAAGEPGAEGVLARALLETGAPQEAAAIARQALETGADPDLSLILGEANLSMKKFATAIVQLEAASEAGLLRAHVALAYALARAGQVERARIEASGLQLRHADDPMVLAGVTVVYNLIGDLPAAQAGSEQAQLASHEHGGALALSQGWLDRAAKRHARGDLEGALWLGLPAASLTPEDGHLSWVLGTWWLQSDEHLHAASYLHRALSLPPYSLSGAGQGVVVMTAETLDKRKKAKAREQIALSLALCHEVLGDPRAEADALQLAIDAVDTPSSEALFKLSVAYERAGRFSESAQAAVAAAEADPTHAAAHFRVAQGYAAAKRVDVAIRYGLQAWQHDTGNPEIALLLADLFMQRREPKQALEILDVAVEANPRRQDVAETRDAVLRQSSFPY